jgi:uncharacterized protein YjbI with pentapeptide repeats
MNNFILYAFFFLFTIFLFPAFPELSKTEQLETQKMSLEISKLQQELQRSKFEGLIKIVPVITAFVAFMGLLATFWKQINESNAKRNSRFDEYFTIIAKNLGSELKAERYGAAISLTTFLNDRYKTFHDQIFYLLVASLQTEQVKQDAILHRLLIMVFERSITFKSENLQHFNGDFNDKDKCKPINLEGCDLSGLNLRNKQVNWLNISRANFQGADLRDAELHRLCADDLGTKTNFTNVKAMKVKMRKGKLNNVDLSRSNFSGAILVDTHFKESTLHECTFISSDLRSCQFAGAEIKNSNFVNANVANANFTSALVDKKSVVSLFKAREWRKAIMDDDLKSKLYAMQKQTYRRSKDG